MGIPRQCFIPCRQMANKDGHKHWMYCSIPWLGRLRGLAVACWTTEHYHPCSNPGVGISEGCFVIDLASLRLEVARPI